MMQSLGCLALALLQDDGGLARNVHLMTIFLGIVAAAVVIGFLGMCVAGIKLLQLMRKAEGLAERMEAKISPMVDKTHALVEQLGPKVHTITTNVEQISYTVRSKVDEFSVTADELNRTVKDANKRTQAQVARVDGIVNEALHSAQNVSRTVQESVRKPVQQIAGIIAGVKRGIETWVERSPFKRHMAEEEEYRAYDTPPPSPPPRYAGPSPTATTGTSGPAATTPTGETKRMTPYG
jgi:methyl-accepting chemotaxis protein